MQSGIVLLLILDIVRLGWTRLMQSSWFCILVNSAVSAFKIAGRGNDDIMFFQQNYSHRIK